MREMEEEKYQQVFAHVSSFSQLTNTKNLGRKKNRFHAHG
jgi:hypothetical protein